MSFTKEQQFAYRLHKLLSMAFEAGAEYGAANPAAMKRKMQMLRDDQLDDMHLPPVHKEFARWASKNTHFIESYFGVQSDVLAEYFGA